MTELLLLLATLATLSGLFAVLAGFAMARDLMDRQPRQRVVTTWRR